MVLRGKAAGNPLNDDKDLEGGEGIAIEYFTKVLRAFSNSTSSDKIDDLSSRFFKADVEGNIFILISVE